MIDNVDARPRDYADVAAALRPGEVRTPDGSGVTLETLPAAEQYRLEVEAFSRRVRAGTAPGVERRGSELQPENPSALDNSLA